MIVHPDEVEGPVAVSVEQHEECREITFDADDNLAPVFLLTSGLLPEAVRMQMGSVIPYFVESILVEAGVDFDYEEIETELIDQDYTASIGFHIRRQDLPGFFETVRESGAASVYDFLFFHEGTEIILTHTSRLFLAGFDADAIEDAKERFHEAIEEGGEAAFPDDGGETEVVRYGQQDPPDGVPTGDDDAAGTDGTEQDSDTDEAAGPGTDSGETGDASADAAAEKDGEADEAAAKDADTGEG